MKSVHEPPRSRLSVGLMEKLKERDRKPLAWQRTLAGMQKHGARAALACTAPGCGLWSPLSVAALVKEFGPEATLWDRRGTCANCKAQAHYMASPGEGTPFVPLFTGPEYEARRKAFLKS